MQLGQRLLQGAPADPSARGGERGPAQPLGRLTAEEYVESATERIGVHQECAQALPRGGDGEGASERGRSGPAPAADHAHGESGPADALGHVGDPVHQPLFAVGQHQDVLGADLDGPPPHPRIVLVPADEDHSPSARGPAHTSRGVVAHQDERRGLPVASALGHPVVHLGCGARRRAQAQQVVEEFAVLGDDQRSALPPSGGRRWIVCDGSGHGLHPPSLLESRGPCGHAIPEHGKNRQDGLPVNGRRKPAERPRQSEPAMNSPRAGCAGITVQRSRKSCGSWWITVDASGVVNIAVTHTGDPRRPSVRLPQSSPTTTQRDGSWA